MQPVDDAQVVLMSPRREEGEGVGGAYIFFWSFEAHDATGKMMRALVPMIACGFTAGRFEQHFSTDFGGGFAGRCTWWHAVVGWRS